MQLTLRFQRAGAAERQVLYLHIGVPEVGVQPLSGHDRLGPRHRVDDARRGRGGGGLRDGRRHGVEARGDPEPRHRRRQRRPAPDLRRARPSDPALQVSKKIMTASTSTERKEDLTTTPSVP